LLKDERLPKIFGLTFLLGALYLFVAIHILSFTWQTDQDKVFHFTWSTFLKGNIEVENYLGRLGAFVSHFFFYSGFGLPRLFFPSSFSLRDGIC
jgi:S-DNA-T family DNA segregation ATPase FtsK/SpoIIIE